MQLNLLQRAGTILLMVPLLVTSFNSVHKQTAFRTNTVHRNMLPADFLSDPSFLNHLNLLDSSSSSQLLADASTLLDPSTFSDASQILADAAAELGDAAVEAEKTGLWEQYLAIFKGALNLVHSTIDQPLRSVGITQTWGISIAIFTAGMRSLLVPLSIQQSKSAEYMKALKPYMADIREKFKDNEEAQNNAISKLYEDANQNPLAGCFVSLAQLPVFLGLYRGVRLLALDGELQEPFLWIPSLQGPVSAPDYRGMDWITAGWTPGLEGSSIPVPALGWETTLAFLAMPVVLVLLQSLTMSTLQPPIDENATQEERETLEKSQGFLKFLPLMIGFFSLQVPAGLTIYWFTSNLFTLSQSLAVKAYFRANPPKIELPEYWDTALAKDADFDKMSPEERRKAMEAGIRVGPTFEDMVDESRFHCLMERKAFRGESAAWLRLEGSSGSIPTEMESWVKNVKVEPVPAEATV